MLGVSVVPDFVIRPANRRGLRVGVVIRGGRDLSRTSEALVEIIVAQI